jgi:hypothetical protein
MNLPEATRRCNPKAPADNPDLYLPPPTAARPIHSECFATSSPDQPGQVIVERLHSKVHRESNDTNGCHLPSALISRSQDHKLQLHSFRRDAANMDVNVESFMCCRRMEFSTASCELRSARRRWVSRGARWKILTFALILSYFVVRWHHDFENRRLHSLSVVIAGDRPFSDGEHRPYALVSM